MIIYTQEKQTTIMGYITTENSIRYYIKAVAPRILAIIQLVYSSINAVGHFMAHLNTQNPPLYRTYPRRYVFCNVMSPPYHLPFSLRHSC